MSKKPPIVFSRACPITCRARVNAYDKLKKALSIVAEWVSCARCPLYLSTACKQCNTEADCFKAIVKHAREMAGIEDLDD